MVFGDCVVKRTDVIVLDLHAFSDISPGFLTFLAGVRKHAKEADYSIHLVGVTHHMQTILERTGLARRFTYELAE
jgi:anti-anti-sigma regulatory factor